MAKRAFDLVVAWAALLVFSPLLLLIAAAVRISSPGPILFRQTRVGRNLVPFQILKFRTMVVDAEKLGLPLTATRDPRVTSIGSILRKTKLDEFPQLFNIVRGDMSLVGPRPEVPKYVEMFPEDFAQILAVRPGLTDPASIKYRDESAVLAHAADPEQEYCTRLLPDKLALAKGYVERSSLGYDLWLIVKTVYRLFR